MSNNVKLGVAIAAALVVVALFFVFNDPFAAIEGNPLAAPAQVVTQDETLGGGAAAQAGDTVTIHYTGKLENGTVFDTSVGKTPITFTLGSGQVISGMDQGLVGMKEGGKRLLIIPSGLGYGPQDYGPIPGGSTLIFEVELVKVVKAQ